VQRLARPVTRQRTVAEEYAATVAGAAVGCAHAPWKGSGTPRSSPFPARGPGPAPPAKNTAGASPPGSQPTTPTPRKASYARMLKLSAPIERDPPSPSPEDAAAAAASASAAAQRKQRVVDYALLDKLATPPKRPGWDRPGSAPPSRSAPHNSNTALTGRAYICKWQHVPGSQLMTSEESENGQPSRRSSSRFQVASGGQHSYAAPPRPPPGCLLPEPKLPEYPLLPVQLVPPPILDAVDKPSRPRLRQPPVAPPEPENPVAGEAPVPPQLRQPQMPERQAEIAERLKREGAKEYVRPPFLSLSTRSCSASSS
jgi:hypothetical protein